MYMLFFLLCLFSYPIIFFLFFPIHTPIRHCQTFQNCHEILAENVDYASVFSFLNVTVLILLLFFDSCVYLSSIIRHSVEMTTIDDLVEPVEFDFFDIIDLGVVFADLRVYQFDRL